MELSKRLEKNNPSISKNDIRKVMPYVVIEVEAMNKYFTSIMEEVHHKRISHSRAYGLIMAEWYKYKESML